MENELKELEATCPFCKAVGTIKIPVQIYSQKKWGTVKIQVPPGAICKEHQFIVLVDTKGIIRGTEKVEVVTAGNGAAVDAPKEFITLSKLIEIVSLKNMHYILHALVFNYPIYVIKSDSLKSTNQIKQILDQVVTENLRTMLPPIEVIEEVIIQDIILNENHSLLIGAQNEILQVPWKEKLKYEESILQKARDIFNEAEQLVILQQEIAKLARDSELARGILEYYDEISRDEFAIELTKKMRITKIDKGYINMIKLFVEKRYSKDLVDKIKKKIKVKK